MKKALFKKGDMFFHPTQRCFVVIDDIRYFEQPNAKGDSGHLYTLKCFQHKNDLPRPYKNYWENRMINELQPMKKTKAVKVLYGDNNK